MNFTHGQVDTTAVPIDTASIEDTAISIDTTIASINTDSINVDSNKVEVKQNIFENDKVKLIYRIDSIKLQKNEVVTNLIKIINVSSEPISFTVTNIYPAAWQIVDVLDNGFKQLQPNDTLFYPILLIPSKTYRQGSNLIINTILEDSINQTIGNHYFNIYSDKQISWNTEINPDRKIYLKNNETSGVIKYTITNTGPYKQDFFISHKTLGSNLLISDTLGNVIEKSKTVSLESNADTTIYYKLSAYKENDRNFKRVPSLSYVPNYMYGDKKYTMFLESRDPKELRRVNKKGDKVDFIKLPNQVLASDLSSSTLPLIVEAAAQNIFDDNVFMSLNMRGYKSLNNQASLIYFTQFNYSTIFANTQFITNAPWYVGYFDDKIQAELGQVSRNMIGVNGAGKGAKFSYRFNDQHKTSAFYTRGLRLFEPPRNEGVGISHDYKVNSNLRFKAGIGRSANYSFDGRTNAANLSSNFRFAKKHFLSVLVAGSNSSRVFQSTNYNFNGLFAGLGYSSSFFKSKLKSTINGRYNDRFFGNGGFESLQINQISNLRINDNWKVFINNLLFDNASYNLFEDTIYLEQNLFNNSLLFHTSTSNGIFQPGIFYNYSDIADYKLHSRGLLFRYSKGDYTKNFLLSSFFRAGYNDAIDFPDLKNFFILENNTILRYRVWTINTRYLYGANSRVALEHMLAYGLAPQFFRLNLQNQHLFKNEHFVIENSFNYTYNNIFKRHGLGYFPQLFYFTNSGWRFAINASYNFYSNDYGSFYTSSFVPIQEQQGNEVQNYNFGFSVRKEFAIPIPFIESKSVDCDFVAFYDLNGNSIKEENEPTIENVIINLDNTSELITDKNGIGKVKNISLGNHYVSLTRLEGVDGWFSNIGDSLEVITKGNIYLPFVRGVKVYGEVFLDRQEIGVVDKDKKFDLSRIKITATNVKTYHTLTDVNGKFEFYLPNGDYLITMDENVLGTKYKMSSNNIPVKLTYGQTDTYVSFYVSEKRRKVTIKEF